MHRQDNESLRSQVSSAVLEAVLEAGRRPGSGDIHLDVNEVCDGMCDAMATFAATIAQMPEDREQGVQTIVAMEERLVLGLRFMADKVRSGELVANPPVRPKPRLVT